MKVTIDNLQRKGIKVLLYILSVSLPIWIYGMYLAITSKKIDGVIAMSVMCAVSAFLPIQKIILPLARNLLVKIEPKKN